MSVNKIVVHAGSMIHSPHMHILNLIDDRGHIIATLTVTINAPSAMIIETLRHDAKIHVSSTFTMPFSLSTNIVPSIAKYMINIVISMMKITIDRAGLCIADDTPIAGLLGPDRNN